MYVGATRSKRELDLLCYEGKFGEPAGAGRTFIGQLLGEEPPAAPEPQFNPHHALNSVPQLLQPQKERPRGRGLVGQGQQHIQLGLMAGAEVVHKQFGKGEILGRLGSIALIAFEDMDEVKRVDLTTCVDVVEKTWKDAAGQIKTVVNNVVFPALDMILAIAFFGKVSFCTSC